MFAVGDQIIYGGMGVCVVESIEERRQPHSKEEFFVYCLRPLYQKCSVTTPTDNNKVFMRPVITKEEADQLIDTIPQVRAEPYYNKVLRQLSDYYESRIKRYDCSELIELTMSLYAKRRETEAQKKKFGAVDERYMKRAEDLLFGELAVALGLQKDEVQSYISRRLNKPEAEELF